MFASSVTWRGLSAEERHLRIVRTYAKRHPSWMFCHVSAAVTLGMNASFRSMAMVRVVTSSSRLTHGSSRVMRHATDDGESIVVDGVMTTSPVRTVFDCVRSMPLHDGIVVADSAMRVGLSKVELLEYVASRKGYRGVRQAAETLAFSDGRAESGGESIARTAMAELGFMPPELQVEIVDPVDGSTRRVDFLWELAGGIVVAGELDGHAKRVNPRMTGGRTPVELLEQERLRESRLTLGGIRFLRFSYRDVCNPKWFAHLLEAAGIPRLGAHCQSRVR